MATDPEPRRPGGTDSWDTSTAASEETPLLRSDTSSSRTARDESPSTSERPPLSDNNDASLAAQPLGWKRTTCIVLSMWALIFLQASNMSGMSTTQSTIAADLDAYEQAMWFTGAYMISLSSVAPLAGRLAMIFSPATMIMLSSACFAVGALVTAVAPSFAAFILGRVILGMGSGGIMTLCMILIIQLTSKQQRGLWIGLANAVSSLLPSASRPGANNIQGFTIGVSAGAIVFGALLPVLGWVSITTAFGPMSVN